MIRGVTSQLEQIFAPVTSHPIIPNSFPLVPLRGTDPPPHILVSNHRFNVVLYIETNLLLDRSPFIHTDQVASITRYANKVMSTLTDCLFSGDSPLQAHPFLKQLVRVSEQSFFSEAVLLYI
jgi:hypothetical protein